MNFNTILKDYPQYQQLKASLDKAPISVSGIEEAARAQLISTLFAEQESSALVICYSDMEARDLAAVSAVNYVNALGIKSVF